MNNNINRSPVVGEYMNNTTHKTEEKRSFQEERRDVMKMDRFFTGLVALVAGLALSAGSAYATAGYRMGDAAPMKLVPHYEIGDSKATIIGVQNTMSGDNDTHECQDAPAPGTTPTPLDASAAQRICLVDFDKDERTPPTISSTTNTISVLGGGTVTPAQQLAMANAQANTDDGKYLVVTAIAYGPSGNMQADTEICLAPGAFGYVVIGKMDMDMDMMPNGAMLSMDDGIGVDGEMTTTNDDGTRTTEPMPAYNGYVTLTASARVPDCDGRRTPSTEAKVTLPTDPLPVADNRDRYIANPAIAAWTIVQDVGMGFFGVEVPTVTITTMRGEDNIIQADSQELQCYDTDRPDGTPANEPAVNGSIGSAEPDDTEWNMAKCGLIPERHNNDRMSESESEGATSVGGNRDPDTRGDSTTTGADAGYATPPAKVTVRYDADDETKVYVWLGAKGRELDVAVRCEEGLRAAIDDPTSDILGHVLPSASIMVPGRTKIIEINPSMDDEVNGFVDGCMGSRGVLEITMPDRSIAGMVWSHITQMDGHYRMNFPGYSMANPSDCRTTGGTTAQARFDACM